jgi:hypothetical protein
MVDSFRKSDDARRKDDFELYLTDTIIVSIRDLLGESPMQAILYNLNLEILGKDPEQFDKKLREMLMGPATIVEEIIIKDLFKGLDLLYSPGGDFDFVKFVDTAKKIYLSRKHRGSG